MTTYIVTYWKNGETHDKEITTNMSPVEIGLYFKEVEKTDKVFGIKLA